MLDEAFSSVLDFKLFGLHLGGEFNQKTLETSDSLLRSAQSELYAGQNTTLSRAIWLGKDQGQVAHASGLNSQMVLLYTVAICGLRPLEEPRMSLYAKGVDAAISAGILESSAQR